MITTQKLNKITDFATNQQRYKISEEILLDRISNITQREIEKIQPLYTNSTFDRPVNFLRKKIIEQLAGKKIITKEWLDDQKNEIEKLNRRLSFRSYSTFSILFPLIEEIELEINVNQYWREISSFIISSLNIDLTKVKTHSVDFNGPRGFGGDRTWLAIYNSSHQNQTTAKQFFFIIDPNGLTISFYDRYNDHHIEKKKILVSDDYIHECIMFFSQYVSQLLENSPQTLINRVLGVRGANIFKLSHGTEYFDDEKIQYCITNNLAVVHEETNPKGRQNFSQYELFESAKIGDVFYLTHGNSGVLLIGQFVDSRVIDFEFDQQPNGWKQKKYKLLYYSSEIRSYKGPKAWWAPNDPSTFTQINIKDISEANRVLFAPHFRVELNEQIQAELPSTQLGIGSDMEIPTIDKNVDPKLDAILIASQFARLISNMKSEKGQFLGIFGRWGRGKTFFAERVFELINDSRYQNNIRFTSITFNAWKYQDSNAIWAYIYETLQEEYFKLSNGKWIRRLILIWKLNNARKGNKDIWILTISFLSSIVWLLLIPSDWKSNLIIFLASNVGLFLLKSFILFRNYSPRIKQVYKEYTKIHSYKSHLGLHAEIQEEVKILLETWFSLKIKPKPHGWKLRFFWKRDYQKILFFVDDLDRCEESKIIQVIDSLRVMLEDPKIVEHIIIIGAIDESILKTAIQWKYKDLLDFQDAKNTKDNRSLEITTREYMDKLFIGGIKLPALSPIEQHSILENYLLKSGILEIEPIITSANIILNPIEEEEENVNNKFEFPDSIYEDFVLSQDRYFIIQSELKYLSLSLEKYNKNEFTPRQLRIYLNRYLFAKNLASSYSLKETGIKDLDNKYSLYLADQIAAKTVNINSKIDLERLKRLNLQPKLEEFTPKLIEMVVPY